MRRNKRGEVWCEIVDHLFLTLRIVFPNPTQTHFSVCYSPNKPSSFPRTQLLPQPSSVGKSSDKHVCPSGSFFFFICFSLLPSSPFHSARDLEKKEHSKPEKLILLQSPRSLSPTHVFLSFQQIT